MKYRLVEYKIYYLPLKCKNKKELEDIKFFFEEPFKEMVL